jgi:hypothetical protein
MQPIEHGMLNTMADFHEQIDHRISSGALLIVRCRASFTMQRTFLYRLHDGTLWMEI